MGTGDIMLGKMERGAPSLHETDRQRLWLGVVLVLGNTYIIACPEPYRHLGLRRMQAEARTSRRCRGWKVQSDVELVREATTRTRAFQNLRSG